MQLFDLMTKYGHEQVVACHEPSCGYRGIIAIHDTTLGPALGGTRFWNYATEDDALTDVLRLSRGMTYKAAVAGLSLGGGKSVIKPSSELTAGSSKASAGATSPPRTSVRPSMTWH